MVPRSANHAFWQGLYNLANTVSLESYHAMHYPCECAGTTARCQKATLGISADDGGRKTLKLLAAGMVTAD